MALFEIPAGYLTGANADFYDVELDDQRFLMGRRLGGGPLGAGAQRLILVQNFFEELQERVPN